jgi:short-subunit dehydrogenase
MKKAALITGGSSGLGLEIGRRLAAPDRGVVLLARHAKRLDEAKADLGQMEGIDVSGFPCDVADEAGLRAVYRDVSARYDQLDWLVLNAGCVHCKLLRDFTDAKELRQDLETNLWGAILTTYVFQPLLKPSSKVLIISSGFGLMGPAGYTVYAASKAGLINFGESLRRELLCQEVAVHVACPGDLDTPQYHEEHKNQPEWMEEDTKRGKIMSPAEAAEKILRRCRKKRNFLILLNSEIHSLNMVNRLLPRTMRDHMLDGMFSRPR